MSYEPFSQEVFDLFIDELSDSISNLKSLSLVSRSWLPRARKHLFRQLRISPIFLGSVEQGTRMLESWVHLVTIPEIKRCVKGLVINDSSWAAGSRFGGAEARAKTPLYSVGTPVYVDHYSMTQMVHTPQMFMQYGPNVDLVGSAAPVSEGYLSSEPKYPCSPLEALPTFNLDFLSYKWGTCCEYSIPDTDGRRLYYSSQGPLPRFRLEKLVSFSSFLRKSGYQLQHLHLSDVLLFVPYNQDESFATAFDPFEALAAFSPSLKSLCISGMSWIEISKSRIRYADSDAHKDLTALSRVFKQPSATQGPLAGQRKLMLTRFYCRAPEMSNSAMNIVLFDNRFLDFADLVHLAIDTTIIPLFVDRPEILLNIKHLTLFVTRKHDARTRWHYDQARLALPSLVYLQVVVTEYESILTSCRAILGPPATKSTIPHNHDSMCMQWPGTQYYLTSTASDSSALPTIPLPAYPEAGSGIYLHIELHQKRSKVKSSLNQQIDRTLLSYINLGTLESSGPLDHISVDRSDILTNWPLLAATGRLDCGEGDHWWEVKRW